MCTKFRRIMSRKIFCMFLILTTVLTSIDITVLAAEIQDENEAVEQENLDKFIEDAESKDNPEDEEVDNEISENLGKEESEKTKDESEMPEREDIADKIYDITQATNEDADGELSGQCGNNLTWMLKDGVLTISGTGSMRNYLPEIGAPAPWAEYSDRINSLILNEGITIIGNFAFDSCNGLNGNLVIPKSVTNIGFAAFNGCSGLTGDLVLPANMESIGTDAFKNCSGLTGDLVIPEGVLKIDSSAFSGCSGFTGNLVIPKSMVYIGPEAFSGCNGLTGDLLIPKNLANIYRSTFSGCSGLTGDLVIPDSVTYIDSSAFSGCSGFTGKLTITDSVSVIPDSTFYNCSGLTGDLVIPDGVTYIGSSAFNGCSGLNGKILIPKSVTDIRAFAFKGIPNPIIYGYANSYAETYAIENNIPFIPINTIATDIYVSTADELLKISNDVSEGNDYKEYVIQITNDIDLNGVKWKPIGNAKEYPFRGSIQGNGHTILGMSCAESVNGLIGYWDVQGECFVENIKFDNMALKGKYSGGIASTLVISDQSVVTIKNIEINGTINGTSLISGGVFGTININGNSKVEVVECNVNVSMKSYDKYNDAYAAIGGIAGQIADDGGGEFIFRKCNIEGDLITEQLYGYCSSDAGGLIGSSRVSKLTIEQCCKTGLVSCKAYYAYTGGFIGNANIADSKIEINNCYVNADISPICTNGTAVGGGLIGHTDGTGGKQFSISNVYVTGSINASSKDTKAAFVSWYSDSESPVIRNCYFDMNKLGLGKDSMVCSLGVFTTNWISNNITDSSGLSTSAMKLQSSYMGWDFENVWEMGEDYPVFKKDSDILETADTGIIEAVERYTSDKEVKEVLEIFNSSASDEEKCQRLFEYYNYDNMLDVRERLIELSNMHDERWDYEGLIRDDMYLSWQYYDYLNNTPKGIAARVCLYASGLVFNNELDEWIDPSTYMDGNYPGVEKYKSMLKEFINEQSTSIEWYSYIKETQKFVNSSVGIWSKIEKGEIIKALNDAPDYTSCQTAFNNFVAIKIDTLGDDTFVFEGDKPMFMEAMGYTKDAFKIANIVVDTITDLMDVSCNLKVYETYHNFLMDICDANDLPWELVVAAYQLDRELGMGYLTPIQNILGEIRDLCLKEVLDLKKLSGMEGYLQAISFTSYCINQFVDVGALVENSCKTEGYVLLATHYKEKLESCKQKFLLQKTEENAWAFYEAYIMLWKLRIAGEKKFLDMSQLEGGTAVDNLENYVTGGTIAGLISDLCGYEDKKTAINDNLKLLSGFEFKYTPQNVPNELSYLKKVIIECPVNVEFLTADGDLICTLYDKEETSISNDYGEFICFYRATTGDYVKLAYFHDADSVIINATATETGKVSYTLVETENHETYTIKGFNDVIVDFGNRIQIDTNKDIYTIDTNLDDQVDIEGQLVDKKRLFVQFDYQDNHSIAVEYVNENGFVSLPDTTAQNGKYFLGWYTEPAGKGEKFTSDSIVIKSMTVYANWKQLEMQKLTVPSANVVSNSTVIKGTEIVLSCSNEDAQIFYTLDGTDPTRDSIKYVNPIVINENIIIKAIAIKQGYQNSEVAIFNYRIEETIEVPSGNTYAVTFELQGHGIPLEEYLNYTEIKSGSKIKEPAEPRDSKYLFTGWYKDSTCLNKWDFETDVVEGNVTLYAGWEFKDFDDILPEDLPTDGIIPDGLWAAGITDTTYTSTAITQSFRLYDGNKRLQEKTDYTVSYKNNKAAYTYTDEDYTAFEQALADTGKRTKTDSFDPAKAPQVVIKMKGNYAGTKIVYFRINPKDITGDHFTAGNIAATYSGKKQTPTPSLVWNGKALKYGTDFYIPEYDSAKSDKTAFTQSGTYNLTITGKKNFTGEIPVTLTISDSGKQIAMNKVTVKGIGNQSWTGLQIVPADFTVSYQKDVLSETNGDFTVDFGENKAVGTGTVTLTGTGVDGDGDGYSYIGTKTVTFKINGTAISKVSVNGVDKSYTYTSEAIEPNAVLTYKASQNASPVTLTEGTHYSVSYQKNTDKGTATIIFTGLTSGGYTGTKRQTFKIVSSGISDKQDGDTTVEMISVAFKDASKMQDGVYVAPYMKGGATPEMIVTSGSKTLVSGRDYTLSYTNNKKVALSTDVKAPTVIVKGKGNYAGSKQVKFSIAAKTLTNDNGIRIIAADKVASNKANGYRQTFKIYDADGKALGTGDYEKDTVTYTLIQTENADGTLMEKNELLDKSSVVSVGSVIQITVQGKGIYAGGSATGTYRILNSGYDISKATIQIANQSYTGKPVMITEQGQFKEGKVYVKIGKEKRVLTFGQDIEVVPDSYVNSVNKGTAKVTFRGINGFGGTKTVSYKIGVRSITDFWKGIFNKILKG